MLLSPVRGRVAGKGRSVDVAPLKTSRRQARISQADLCVVQRGCRRYTPYLSDPTTRGRILGFSGELHCFRGVKALGSEVKILVSRDKAHTVYGLRNSGGESQCLVLGPTDGAQVSPHGEDGLISPGILSREPAERVALACFMTEFAGRNEDALPSLCACRSCSWRGQWIPGKYII